MKAGRPTSKKVRVGAPEDVELPRVLVHRRHRVLPPLGQPRPLAPGQPRLPHVEKAARPWRPDAAAADEGAVDEGRRVAGGAAGAVGDGVVPRRRARRAVGLQGDHLDGDPLAGFAHARGQHQEVHAGGRRPGGGGGSR